MLVARLFSFHWFYMREHWSNRSCIKRKMCLFIGVTAEVDEREKTPNSCLVSLITVCLAVIQVVAGGNGCMKNTATHLLNIPRLWSGN